MKPMILDQSRGLTGLDDVRANSDQNRQDRHLPRLKNIPRPHCKAAAAAMLHASQLLESRGSKLSISEGEEQPRKQRMRLEIR